MKKSIIVLGLALVTFANSSFASTVEKAIIKKEFVKSEITPLCAAIIKGDVVAVKKIIEYGADLEETTNNLTPLMVAARYNKAEIIKLLLANGAKKSTKNENGFTALKYAELSNAQDAILILKEAK
ncbi:ankyrin repeat domain-containing protein [Flavobacterium sp.]|uniref:ankyrin repeat domain-containing protein n=1 Tax=Flavobacterium sp. TaxID=239 RepID=UPI00286CE029|nr:ankyrin repeat domain-containing protein [Flavobacterium sp.]